MYCNYELINHLFLDLFTSEEQDKIKEIVYNYYLRLGSPRSRKLSRHSYFKSQRVKYKFVYSYCPKCKKFGLLLYSLRRAALGNIRFCVNCGESNIQYRFSTGLRLHTL